MEVNGPSGIEPAVSCRDARWSDRVSIRIGTGISTEADPLEAGTAAAQSAAEALGGAPADLALVFASGSHLVAPEATLEGVHAVLAPRRARRLRCRRRARRRARARSRHRTGGVGGGVRMARRGDAVSRDAGRRRPRATRSPGCPSLDGSSGVADAVGSLLVPDRRRAGGARGATRPRSPCSAASPARRTGRGDGALFFGDGRLRRRSGRGQPARRRDAAVRLAGRRARWVARSRSPRPRATSSTSWPAAPRSRPSS